MNTKTMLLPPRRVTPSNTTNKRKEREDPFNRPKPTNKLLKPDKPTTTATTSNSSAKPMSSNQLLAGYLAHEYLTKGTLMGQPWAPPQTDVPKEEPTENNSGGEEGEATGASCQKAEEERERYLKVADLVKGGGTHFPGVVNPTQLACFLLL